MSEDPFANEDRTVLQPIGQRQPAAAASPVALGVTDASVRQYLSGINPLENAASPLLSIFVTIKKSVSHPSPGTLKQQISTEIETFRERARQLVDDPKKLTMASYVLCTTLDEAALNTPWGQNSDWSRNSLLSSFHGEVRGGERFFEVLKKLGANPNENLDMLELMYVCLSLGYEGAYKHAKNGQATLVKVRKWLYEILSNAGRTAPDTLSSNWRGADMPERTLPRMAPIWLILAIGAAACALTLFIMQVRLSESAENTIGTFLPLRAAALTAKEPPPPPAPDPVARPTLSDLLSNRVAQGAIGVQELPDRAIVTLVGDNLFASGKAQIDSRAVPLLDEIAVTLNRYDGAILITGHTDNIPIRRPEFPSNLDLSEARAISVAKILIRTLIDPDRIVVEGMGDLQPLNDNSTKELRSRNRRVEIIASY